ncbi:hypothetical protein [Niallia endozanthoxylica]|uniref:Uncharacterized protein n=1 Tax=Niallia endozanthoxylica TaxID=2036016 RepID=A0A5J5I169_9BACI|nr:hypothetical protein [Niallia endozanthoxylica]KAA9029448.1 hypothetical protein F4V44_03125 [Niallia endozanthoxylica]
MTALLGDIKPFLLTIHHFHDWSGELLHSNKKGSRESLASFLLLISDYSHKNVPLLPCLLPVIAINKPINKNPLQDMPLRLTLLRQQQ